ncbi:hypothetical protein FACS189468_0110 [Spirochaetia bacterium]|nr:hypothetical protein FACS189468_0110 [Spirochaetia bacterium]
MYAVTLKRAARLLIPFLAVLFFSACAGTPKVDTSKDVPVSAVPNAVPYTLEPLHMKIDLPGDLYVITRDVVSHPAELEAKNLNIEAIQVSFLETNVYLDAMESNFDYEFVITMIEYEESRKRWDLSALGDTELQDLLLSDKAELAALGIISTGDQIYKTANAVFLAVSFEQPLERDIIVYSNLYYTTVNGMTINIALSAPNVPLTAEQLALHRAVIDNITFTKVPK